MRHFNQKLLKILSIWTGNPVGTWQQRNLNFVVMMLGTCTVQCTLYSNHNQYYSLSHRCFLYICTHSDVPMNSEQSGRGRGRGGWLVDEIKCDLETCEWTLMSSDSIVRPFLQNGAFSIRITSYSQRLGSTTDRQTLEYLCKGLRKFFFLKVSGF